jgi:hypothetical protein
VGLAEGQLADLSELRQVIDLGGETVRRGDHLMKLLHKQKPMTNENQPSHDSPAGLVEVRG